VQKPQQLLDLIIVGGVGGESGLEVVHVLENGLDLLGRPRRLNYVAVHVVAHRAGHVHRLEQQPQPVNKIIS
jgi:hypothetical protein